MQLITNKISTGQPRRTLKEIVEEHLQKKAAASDPVVKTAAVVETPVKVAEKEADEAPSSGQLDPEPLHQKGESVKPSATKKEDDAVKASVKKDEKDEAASSGQPEWEGKPANNNMQDPKAEEDGKKKEATAEPVTETKEAGGFCFECKHPKGECTCDKGDKGEEKKDCKCATGPKFIKISNLTDKSKKDALVNEFKKVYPAEYCDLMFADR